MLHCNVICIVIIGFLTAVLQNYARKHIISVDSLVFNFSVYQVEVDDGIINSKKKLQVLEWYGTFATFQRQARLLKEHGIPSWYYGLSRLPFDSCIGGQCTTTLLSQSVDISCLQHNNRENANLAQPSMRKKVWYNGTCSGKIRGDQSDQHC